MADDDGDESYFRNGILPDPDADQRFSNMLFDLVGQINDAQSRGLSVRDILDPASQHYIGDRLIAAHRATPSERLAAWGRKIRDATPHLRQDDEEIGSYVRRISAATMPPPAKEKPISPDVELAEEDDAPDPDQDQDQSQDQDSDQSQDQGQDQGGDQDQDDDRDEDRGEDDNQDQAPRRSNFPTKLHEICHDDCYPANFDRGYYTGTPGGYRRCMRECLAERGYDNY